MKVLHVYPVVTIPPALHSLCESRYLLSNYIYIKLLEIALPLANILCAIF